LVNIGTEQQANADSMRRTAVDEVGDENLPLQGDVPHPLGVQVQIRLHGFKGGEAAQVGEGDFAIVLALSAPWLLLPRVEIAQIGIATQFTDQV